MPDSQTPQILLNNGIAMPQLGLGVFKVQDGIQTEQSVATALRAGYRLIDTAAIYGNETGVGKAIADSYIPREELFVTTKLWNDNQGYESTLEAFSESLDKLGLDYIDLYLIHWPKPKLGKVADTWRAFEELYADGKVRAIGVSNFTVEHLERLLETAEITPAVNQVELHPKLIQQELRDYCDKKGIRIEAWSPLMQGGDLLEDAIILDIAQSCQKSPAQVILRWHIQLGLIVIPKSVTPDRIKSNIDIFDFELSTDEMQRITSLNQNMRVGPNPDTF